MSGARAWALSVALHAILLAAAWVIAGRAAQTPEVLRWQVSLVRVLADTPAPETSVPEAAIAPQPPSVESAPPDQPPARPPPAAALGQAAEVAASSPPGLDEKESPPPSPGKQVSPDDGPAPTIAAAPMARPRAPSPALEPAAMEEHAPVGDSAPALQVPPAEASKRLWYAALVERLRDRHRYPLQARRRGQEGVVALEIVVEADGVLRELTLMRGSGYPVLDRAAEELVRQAMDDMRGRLRPERVTRLEIPIAYQLRN